MADFWSKARLSYNAIVSETIGQLQLCTGDTAETITEQLHDESVPWQSICNLYGGSSGQFPGAPIRAAIDGYVLKIAILAIVADGHVSERELSTCWPMTRELAISLGRQFSDLRDFDHATVEGHSDFLRTFNEKESWFGGACDWLLAAAPMLVFDASVIADAQDEDSGERRSLFKKFRALCLAIVRDIIECDGVSDREATLVEQISNHFDGFLGHTQTTSPRDDNRDSNAQAFFSDAETASSIASVRQKTVTREEALNSALAELQQLIGLESVKQEVQRLTAFLRIQEERKRQNLKTATQSLHFVFKGNPGTGKTVVARILGKVFYGFGILDSFNVVECDRSRLVGGFVGQTAIKTDEVIESALDGVLFIDEAYTLSRHAGGNDYGDEAINQLLKRMEDDRKRLIVIVAGYPKLMDEFIATNPGLRSRFTRYIAFDDYTAAELCQIFEKFAGDDEYKLSEDCCATMAALFAALYARRGSDFGNARDARNIYEKAVALHSERIDQNQNSGLTKEQLTTLSAAEANAFLKPIFGQDQIDLSKARWQFKCSNCGHAGTDTSRFLGRRVKCKCGSGFVFPWWDLIPESVPELHTSEGRARNPFLTK